MRILSAIISFHLLFLSVEPMVGSISANLFSESCRSSCGNPAADYTCQPQNACEKAGSDCSASGSLCIFSINCCCCLCFYFDDAKIDVRNYAVSDVSYFSLSENFSQLFSSGIFQLPETV